MGADLSNIHRILIWSNKDRDKLIWPYNISGEANTKVMYERLCEIAIQSTLKNGLIAQPSHPKLWKQAWHLKSMLKIKTFMCRLLSNALVAR